MHVQSLLAWSFSLSAWSVLCYACAKLLCLPARRSTWRCQDCGLMHCLGRCAVALTCVFESAILLVSIGVRQAVVVVPMAVGHYRVFTRCDIEAAWVCGVTPEL